VAASGHLRTDEVNDRTGMPDRLLALERAIVLEGRPLRMAIGISRGNVEVVEHAGALDQIRGHPRRVRKLREQSGHDVSPPLLSETKMQRLHGLFRRLLRREAGPFVMSGPSGILGLIQVVDALVEPITSSIGHGMLRCNSRVGLSS